MAEYYNVTTNLGDAEIANAIATNTKLNITHIAFGDGNGSVPIPNKARTSLVREVHRQAVTKYERHATNANWIVIETIIPSSIGGFWVREMGIIANGKLISHGSHAPFEKVADPSGVSEYRLRFTQNVTDGSVVEITLDESLIYASQAWVEENFIKRTEIVDNLITADPNKPLSANAGKSLQDGKLGKNDNAVSATQLQTARTIGGVSFNGTANINLPGVNVAGNQSTSGNAATATTAAACSGNAATATKLQTARTIGGVNFNGTANINLPGVNTAGNQNTTGNAASATKLQTARTIAISGAVTGTATGFDGSGDISISAQANTDNLRVVNGSGYTITYDDARRIAIIQMTLWTNKSIISQTLTENSDSNRHQIYSLPITLKARLSADISVTEEGTTVLYYDEAFEWIADVMPDGYRGNNANSKLFTRFRRWCGGGNEAVTAIATIVGIF